MYEYRTRGVEIGRKDISLTHLEEAYTTEHWLVRIYKVKDLSNRPAPKLTNAGAIGTKKGASKTKSRRGSSSSSASRGRNKEGVIKNRPVVVKGKRKNKAKK